MGRARGAIQPADGQLWSFDGKALFFQDERNRLMRVAVTPTPELSVSAPVEVADTDKLGLAFWSVLPDGRFLVGVKNENEGDITQYWMVENWTQVPKQKLRGMW